MSEETTPQILERAKDDVSLLEYDYLKHISTLSLVTLGGVLTLAQSNNDLSKQNMIVAVVLVAIGGAFALGGIDLVISAKKKGKALGWMFRWTRTCATGAFGTGIGVFLGIFLDIFS